MSFCLLSMTPSRQLVQDSAIVEREGKNFSAWKELVPQRCLPQGSGYLSAVEASTRASSGVDGRSDEFYWNEYFADPSQWWDNRGSKSNTRSPDFKHKRLKKALWIDGWYTPGWVKSKFGLKAL